MSDPLVSPADLGTLLNDSSINTARASLIIDFAQALCETICNPLPPTGAVIVARVAVRAYGSMISTRGNQMVSSGLPMAGNALSGVSLTNADKADLRRLNGGGGAFTINLLPDNYRVALPPWDVDLSSEPQYDQDVDDNLGNPDPPTYSANFSITPGQQAWVTVPSGQTLVATILALPSGEHVEVKNLAQSLGNVTLTAADGSLINGSSTYTLTPGVAVTLTSNGSAITVQQTP